mmetsp:Transcript_23516/g.56948  ORF Transcript_23516/g.56948 Transcript_23516/m.56948 type:complete len:585 (-) Transcript_23516:602-2356(-)
MRAVAGFEGPPSECQDVRPRAVRVVAVEAVVHRRHRLLQEGMLLSEVHGGHAQLAGLAVADRVLQPIERLGDDHVWIHVPAAVLPQRGEFEEVWLVVGAPVRKPTEAFRPLLQVHVQRRPAEERPGVERAREEAAAGLALERAPVRLVDDWPALGRKEIYERSARVELADRLHSKGRGGPRLRAHLSALGHEEEEVHRLGLGLLALFRRRIQPGRGRSRGKEIVELVAGVKVEGLGGVVVGEKRAATAVPAEVLHLARLAPAIPVAVWAALAAAVVQRGLLVEVLVEDRLDIRARHVLVLVHALELLPHVVHERLGDVLREGLLVPAVERQGADVQECHPPVFDGGVPILCGDPQQRPVVPNPVLPRLAHRLGLLRSWEGVHAGAEVGALLAIHVPAPELAPRVALGAAAHRLDDHDPGVPDELVEGLAHGGVFALGQHIREEPCPHASVADGYDGHAERMLEPHCIGLHGLDAHGLGRAEGDRILSLDKIRMGVHETPCFERQPLAGPSSAFETVRDRPHPVEPLPRAGEEGGVPCERPHVIVHRLGKVAVRSDLCELLPEHLPEPHAGFIGELPDARVAGSG